MTKTIKGIKNKFATGNEATHQQPKRVDQKRIRKKCIGCCDTFTCYQSKNYDYCKNCKLNGSRYLNKNSQCPECDGSGLIKFPNQSPRNCKLCYLTKGEILAK